MRQLSPESIQNLLSISAFYVKFLSTSEPNSRFYTGEGNSLQFKRGKNNQTELEISRYLICISQEGQFQVCEPILNRHAKKYIVYGSLHYIVIYINIAKKIIFNIVSDRSLHISRDLPLCLKTFTISALWITVYYT